MVPLFVLELKADDTFTLAGIAKIIGGPLVSAIIAAVVAYIVSIRTTRTQRRISLDSVRNKLIELALQYPHLERDEYCRDWSRPAPDPITKDYQDERDRYDNYCCYVFNMIHASWEFAGGKVNKIDDMLSIQEYIGRHWCWWEDDNIHYYDTKFCSFVDDVIRQGQRIKL